MLAQKYEDRKNETPYPLYCQPKLDGIRCIVQRRDTTKELQSIDEVELVAKTRNGKVIDAVPHILESLRAFFISHPRSNSRWRALQPRPKRQLQQDYLSCAQAETYSLRKRY